MLKSPSLLCRKCQTLAEPICECGILATKSVDGFLVAYSDDLSVVSLVFTWKDAEGRLKWLEETDLLAKSVVSRVYDIVL